MLFTNKLIKQKLRAVILLTSSSVLLLISVAFMTYEVFAMADTLKRDTGTLAEIIANASTATLLYSDEKDARNTLSALVAEPHIVAACFYTTNGTILASYPQNADRSRFPQPPLHPGSRFQKNSLVVVQPVIKDQLVVGTFYLRSNLGALYKRIQLYFVLVLLVLIGSLLLALAVSNALQKVISEPILALTGTAKMISEKKDYSVRAVPLSQDEIGTLTDSFNDMLTQIQERDAALRESAEQLEQRVLDRTAELAATNRELEAFTYSVSHDLRAPLRHIDGYSKMLIELCPQLPAEAEGYLDRIRASTQYMGRLVDDLLNLARLGRKELTYEKVDLEPLVNEVLEELKEDAAGRPIEWQIGPLPEAQCDRGLVRQVLVNLISNAIKYTRPREKPVIQIGHVIVEGTPAIFVRDNGVGFNMKYVNKLFGVFQRLHKAEDFEGTGVGLATVDRIIRKHGGRVWAESELDKGTTFYFTLQSIAQEI